MARDEENAYGKNFLAVCTGLGGQLWGTRGCANSRLNRHKSQRCLHAGLKQQEPRFAFVLHLRPALL